MRILPVEEMDSASVHAGAAKAWDTSGGFPLPRPDVLDLPGDWLIDHFRFVIRRNQSPVSVPWRCVVALRSLSTGRLVSFVVPIPKRMYDEHVPDGSGVSEVRVEGALANAEIEGAVPLAGRRTEAADGDGGPRRSQRGDE